MATWTKRLVVGVVSIMMLVSLAPPAVTQPAAAEEDAAAQPVSETFVPGEINRDPEGGAVPAEMDELLGGQGMPEGERRELVERRTEDSQTFDAGNGVLETVFYDGAVNYLDEAGDWQPIDPTLMPSSEREAGCAARPAP